MVEVPTNYRGLVEEWHGLSRDERVETFLQLPADEADNLFLSLSARDQVDLLQQLRPAARRLWIRLLEPDDAADVIQAAPENMRLELMRMMDDTARREVSALLAYKEDVAGGLMSPRFARVRPDVTADEAIAYLRLQSGKLETLHYTYVLDSEQRLLGVLTLKDLFTCGRDCRVRDIMSTDFVSAPEDLDQEGLVRLVAETGLLAVPILDAEGRMQGIVTADDIVDVVTEEASEDIQKIGGSEALDAPYLDIGFWSMIRKRAGWLSILFIGQLFTAAAMARYEDEIASAIVLAVFLPLIISSGGNSGSQAATLIIRAMAVGDVRMRDWSRVLRREILTGIVLGVLLALLGAARIGVWQAMFGSYGEHALTISLTVAISLVGVVLWGTFSGSLLPFALQTAGLDPASASAPFVATLVDVIGVIIYFTIAGLMLTGTLL